MSSSAIEGSELAVGAALGAAWLGSVGFGAGLSGSTFSAEAGTGAVRTGAGASTGSTGARADATVWCA
jgi:hypothetical protein